MLRFSSSFRVIFFSSNPIYCSEHRAGLRIARKKFIYLIGNELKKTKTHAYVRQYAVAIENNMKIHCQTPITVTYHIYNRLSHIHSMFIFTIFFFCFLHLKKEKSVCADVKRRTIVFSHIFSC